MEVVYLFCESSVIRVPFFGGDQRLFNLIASQSGGVWDNERHEFIFKRNEGDAEFGLSITGIPWVWVEKTSPAPFRVFGFWERPWKKSTALSSPRHDEATKKAPEQGFQTFQMPPSSFSLSFTPPVPEKFSECWQDKLEAELRARKYSSCTIRAYVYYNRLLCRVMQKIPEDIVPGDITPFLASVEKDREYSAASMNLAISAIKFFYKNILEKDGIVEQRRPRDDKRIPQVFSKEEIGRVLSMEKNPKHRLLLMLVYSSGLRVSEVVALKKDHIDLSRRVIYVERGKGRKDRCTILSEKAAHFIAEYCTFYGIQTWLFPGQPSSRPLTIRSAQHIFDKAVRHAEIPKKTSIHSLRHTFATHLLESGTDIRYIQTLLGHANLRTTERYTHVARRSILNIKSPLDTM